MSTITIELPDELFARVASLPPSERKAMALQLIRGEYAQIVQDNLLDAIDEEMFAAYVESQQLSPEEDGRETIAVVNEALDDIANGGCTYSMEGLMARYGITQEDLDNTPDGIINGHIK